MKKNGFATKKRADLIFCLLLLAIPMIQFAIFYIGVNINSFVMVFQKYEIIDMETMKGGFVSNGFNNFSAMVQQMSTDRFDTAVSNSLTSFIFITLVGITLSLVFSLYIYKKLPGAGVFRVLLFAPSILSAVVMVTMFKYFAEFAIPELFDLKSGLLGNAETKLGTIIFYNVWIGFGTQVLMYSGAMSGIDNSVMEAARLDGASPVREFFSIILPLIFPTVQTFLVAGVETLVTNQINLVAFDGLWAKPQNMTIGYYLFSKAEAATNYELPVLATFGVCLTLIAAPLTLTTRWALDKFGPSVN